MVMLYRLQVVTIGAKTSPLFRTLRKKIVENFTRNAIILPGGMVELTEIVVGAVSG